MKLRRRLALVAVALLGMPACLGPCADAPRCESDDDCAPGFLCTQQSNVRRCLRVDGGAVANTSSTSTSSSSSSSGSSSAVSLRSSSSPLLSSSAVAGSSGGSSSGALSGASSSGPVASSTGGMDGGGVGDGGGLDAGRPPATDAAFGQPEGHFNTQDVHGDWAQASPALASPTRSAAVVVHDGWVHVIGGFGSAALIQQARIQADGTLSAFWTAPMHLVEPRAFASAVVVGGRLFVLGGLGDPGMNTALSSVEVFALNGGELLDAGPPPFALDVARAAAAVTSEPLGQDVRLYVSGGFTLAGNPSPLASLEIIDVTPDGVMSHVISNVTGMDRRDGHASFLVGTQLWVVGGNLGTTGPAERTARVWDTRNIVGTFLDAGVVLPTPWTAGGVLVFPDQVLLVGGCNAGGMGGCPPVETVLRAPLSVDGGLGQFVPMLQRLQQPRGENAAVWTGAHLYAVGGAQVAGAGEVATTEVYRLAKSRIAAWSTMGGALPAPRQGYAAVVLGPTLLMLGGTDGTGAPSPTLYQDLTTSSGVFVDAGHTVGLSHFCTAVVPDAQVGSHRLLVVGGEWPDGGPSRDVLSCATEAWGTVINACVPLGTLRAPRSHHRCVVVGDRLFVLGGVGEQPGVVEHARLTEAGTLFALVANVDLDRQGFGAFAHHNSIYVVGGSDPFGGNAPSVRLDVLPDGMVLGPYVVGGGTGRTGGAVVKLQNTVYWLGGEPSGGAETPPVQHATLSDNGLLGEFSLSAPDGGLEMPALLDTAALVLPDNVVLWGGRLGAGAVDSTQVFGLDDATP